MKHEIEFFEVATGIMRGVLREDGKVVSVVETPIGKAGLCPEFYAFLTECLFIGKM